MLLFFALNAFAATLELVGPCSPTPVLTATFTAVGNAGEASVAVFEKHKTPFQGSPGGFASILNTPTGDDAIQVISDRELRAFGWCYEVDGLQPDVMPDKYSMINKKHLRWFYAFSLNRDGEWVSYCEPAYTVALPTLCRGE